LAWGWLTSTAYEENLLQTLGMQEKEKHEQDIFWEEKKRLKRGRE
jgi:hypothetical protein